MKIFDAIEKQPFAIDVFSSILRHCEFIVAQIYIILMRPLGTGSDGVIQELFSKVLELCQRPEADNDTLCAYLQALAQLVTWQSHKV